MIAVDWGTSSFRAYRVDAAGIVHEKREAPLGILQVHGGQFAQALESQVADWIGAGEGPVVMSGMIGSRQGWHEMPYVPCPADADDIAAHMGRVQWDKGREAWLVPGLVTRDAAGVHDVMRGEETQLVGALEQLGPGRHTVCLPGTHSKWVRVEDGRIEGFTTHMTGELFAVLRDHSILGRTMENAGDDPASFDAGVMRSGEPGGLLHHLFGVRAECLAGRLSAEQAHEYLSGLLIGHEVRAAAPGSGTVCLLCSEALAPRYERALASRGLVAHVLDPDSVVRGLHRLSQCIGARA
jgi:2-dehydro-3-deoxygalactonokinase